MLKRLPWLLLPLAVAVIDLVSKALVVARIGRHEVVTVIPGFFNLIHGKNTGAIFGSFQGAPTWLRAALFTLAGVVAVAYFGYEMLKEETSRLQRVALGLIIGGAIGNGLDRLWHHAVTDFLDVVLFGWHYWTFNIADSAIVCGAILVGLGMVAGMIREKRAGKGTETSAD